METSSNKHENPRENANFISILFWWWTLGIFRRGCSKNIEPEDLYNPLKKDKSDILGDRLETKWLQDLEIARKMKRKPNLLLTIGCTFFPEFLKLTMIQFFNEFICRLGIPLLLGELLQYFKPEPTVTYEAALYFALGICIANGCSAFAINQLIFGSFHLGGQVRIAVCSVAYRKALKLSRTALGSTAPGKIVNLLANDVNRFDSVTVYLHWIWSGPLSACIIAYILYYKAGFAGLVGVMALFVVVPIQAYTGKLTSEFRLQTAIKTDERVRLMDEIISGVLVIKMYAWEKPLSAIVEMTRKLELKVVRKSSYIRSIFMTFSLFTTRMALYCTILTMLFYNQPITPEMVFIFSAYFNELASTMTQWFVRSIAEIAECKVATDRIENFLLLKEFEEGNVLHILEHCGLNNDDDDLNSSLKIQANEESPRDDKINIADFSSGNKFSSELEERTYNESDRLRLVLECILILILFKNIFSNGSNDISCMVRLDNVTSTWEINENEATLTDVNLELKKGKIYCVIGAVGSGKSSLLSTILGEINLIRGKTEVRGKISYAGQDCWVFGSTIRQNILFGETFDRLRYQKVIRVCALQADFKQLPQGDKTIIGERGSSLSGGQKARINLARAVYRKADIYILDDPLSAVDTQVGKHLFKECLKRYLIGKIRILVTHQLQYVKDVDKIILVKCGKIELFSNYHELIEFYPEYINVIITEKLKNEPVQQLDTIKRNLSSSSRKSQTSDIDMDQEDYPDFLDNAIEETSKGVIKGSVFWKYVQIGANIYVGSGVIILFLVTQFIVSWHDYFVPIFISSEEKWNYYETFEQNTSALNDTSILIDDFNIHSEEYYLSIYTGLVCAIFIIALVRSFIFYAVCLRANQKLHDIMFGSLIRTSIKFFDTNPSGRILNRFSKDLGAMDELLPRAILDAAQLTLIMVGAIAVSCIVQPLFIIPLIFLSLLFYWIRKICLRTTKNIKRIEGITRSPVFTHLNATLNGLSTIRAYQAQNILKVEFDKLQDVHSSAWFMFIAATSTFAFSLDIFCFIFSTIIIFSFLLIDIDSSAGDVGLAITQIMALTGIVQWGMRQNAEVINQMMSVERILEYTQLPPEPNFRDIGSTKLLKNKCKDVEEGKFIKLPPNWPTKGHLQFKNVYMRYNDEDFPVLIDLSIEVYPSEKIGIVGRTGAGKSSLISALFRLAMVEGNIIIDGVDTNSMALEDLRNSISIIPQDPVLFSGTLRRNLDPFNEYSDTELWNVLDEVELKKLTSLSTHGLENPVLDRGSNYSVGQKQLICLARAILKNSRVLILDEATANVDPHTETLIQSTIRTKFPSCTVLTIAHRLNTIMDSDRVLVMDKGSVAEFDHPYSLLQNPNGMFTGLVKETGPAMFDQLLNVAKSSYVSHNNVLQDS